MLYPNLFHAAFDDGHIGEGSTTQRVEEVMRPSPRAAMLRCLESAPQTSVPRCIGGTTLASLRQACIRARTLSQHGREKPNYDQLEVEHKAAACQSHQEAAWGVTSTFTMEVLKGLREVIPNGGFIGSNRGEEKRVRIFSQYRFGQA
uniref:Uncharacterized protein n=1 Tax=Timema douglasi TaxID=61478 RepID=A0A7R8ZER4_TIMDO|nr:unnamed protein product [Timema douglasi]